MWLCNEVRVHCIVSCKLASVSHFGPGGEMRGRKCEVVVVVVVVVVGWVVVEVGPGL